jgi:plastocyanin
MRILINLVLVAGMARAESITGTILIQKKLTRRNVTASVSVYHRGPAVELAKDPAVDSAEATDPLAFERSRVVIWVEGAGPAGSGSASIEQSGRRFKPDLVVVPVGSTVSFPNMDPIFHNVFSFSRPRSFDLGNYVKGDTRHVTFNKPGIVYVNCHLHPNMSAEIVVTPNKWYGRSDPNGGFELHDLPPGEYTVVAWHKTAGFFRKKVLIQAGLNPNIEFVIPVGGEAE